MRFVLIFILGLEVATGQTNFQILTTNTQARITYTAPDLNPCTWEISESASYLPLINDVDTTKFANSNLDNRDGFTPSRFRVFIAGVRSAQRGLNGQMFSRALQTLTQHYYRVTCGSNIATGTFTTDHLKLGNSYNEPYPADPAVSSLPYYNEVGTYAWPEFTSWDRTDSNARKEALIDPQTGILHKRVAMPQDAPTQYGYWDPTVGNSFEYASGSVWTNPTNVLVDDGSSATYSASTSDFLYVRDLNANPGSGAFLQDPSFPSEALVLNIKAWCTGACIGDNAKVQACITINGVTCWPTNIAAKYQEVPLGTTANPSTYSILGTATPILASWTPAGYQPLNRAAVSNRQGTVNVDVSSNVTWVGGYYFNPNWVAGTHITIGSSDCSITALSDSKTLTVGTCSPSLSLPLTGASYKGSGFGFLIRKKTASLDTISIQYAKYIAYTSQYMDFTASGSYKLCSDQLTQNSVTGGLGYHCVMFSGVQMLYWTDHTTGDSNFLGTLGVPYVSGMDGFDGQGCGSGTIRGTSPTVAESFYCAVPDHSIPAKTIIAKCDLTSTNQPGSFSCTAPVNLTPSSAGKNLTALIAQFTASDTPAFDPSVFDCGIQGLQGVALILNCRLIGSIQDSLGWVVLFDPTLVSSASGCVGGGAPGCVVAASTTWQRGPASWCGLHTQFVADNTRFVWTAGKFFQANSPAKPGDGLYTSTMTAPLTSAPSIAAGTGACPVGSLGCDVVTVDGEPCDATPAVGESAGAYVCPKNSSWVYRRDAAIGDIFNIADSPTETVKLVAKSGNNWTIQRAYASGQTPTNHSNQVMQAYCGSFDFTQAGTSNSSWVWDTQSDPHGTNPSSSMSVAWDYDHPVPRSTITIGGAPSYDAGCLQGSCYAVRDNVGGMGSPPNRHVALAPSYFGVKGPSQFIEVAQDHPSRLQDTAIDSESHWFFDGRPMALLSSYVDAAIHISGSLFRMTTTTSDGDNLFHLGYNLYVVRTSGTVLTAGGLCSSSNPCPLWNDTTLIESLTTSCTVTLISGSGTAYIARLSSGGMGITYTTGLSISSGCPIASGSTWPDGSTPLWTWTATTGTWDVNGGTDQRGGTSGYFGQINRKIQPTLALCGAQAMIDVSSATTGNVLSDTSTDNYKYCTARKAGECRSGSAQGDIYLNCPNAVTRYASGAVPTGSFGCGEIGPSNDVQVDMCVANSSAYLNSIAQMGFSRNDFVGSLGRSLSKGFGRYKLFDPYFHAKAFSDASWALFRSMWSGGAWTEVLAAKIPPFPPADSIIRSNFQPITFTLNPPSSLAVDNVIVRFGYAENSGSNLYCTSRQEICVANASTIPAIPYLFQSEGSGGVESGITGVPCSLNCKITIPAISQRILYYQIVYRNAVNGTLLTSTVQSSVVQ